MLVHAGISFAVIGAAIEVHKQLGPGLLESAYEQCFCHELALRKVPFERQVALPVRYKGLLLDCGYRLDMVVDHSVLLELKSIEQIHKIHEAQLMSYLRLSGLRVGLLINFNVELIKNGIQRVVNRLAD